MTSLQFPLCAASPFGIMVTEYSPLSLRIRFLSSSDAVDLKRVILSAYAASVEFTSPDVITLRPEKLQATTRKGVTGGVTVVVNVTVSPTRAFRLSGSTPPPWLKPVRRQFNTSLNVPEHLIMQKEKLKLKANESQPDVNIQTESETC